jgi:hypothetical protein
MRAEPQVFTLEAANALVPRLREIVERQLSRRAEIEDRLKALAKETGSVPNEVTPPAPDDTPPVRAIKRELLEKIGTYQEGWTEIESLGAVIKDARTGLVDFYGQVDGRMVWLCWKYGEAEIAHYHALDEGFSGRKPIPPTMRRNLLN